MSFRLLDAWVDAGFNFIDTADVYSAWVPGHRGGESETVLGKWFRQSGKRHRVVLATKVGKPMGPGKSGLKPAYIRQAVEDSLKRLQTDVIDLYQSHDDDADTPLEDTLGAYDALVKAGKVRAIGASNFKAARLAQALQASAANGLVRYESLQPLYNLYDRAVFEDELGPLCQKEGVGVINFYALAAGFLTGKYRSASDAGKSPRGQNTIAKYLNARGLKILAALDEVADRARVRLACTNAIQAAAEVADFAYKGAGVDAIFPGSPFERRFRDMHTLSQQIQARSAHFEQVGQILLGAPPEVFL